ncbi:carbon storage regulator CsrA [Sulfurimonas microaerophilic]|uniref:carbon storage regulator CsrA n=1 Tax=Sulfurimonas microaerophilic TaxID=3058392 RepID=UPI00271546E1|nr:carbon storage regulator CsrA [Sulfurimonas sp. hsl 1-7]
MLVLARKVDESIVIGDNIVVKVVAVENGVVKLGIDAPKDVAILRDELAREVALSNKAALYKSDEDELKSLGKLLGK